MRNRNLFRIQNFIHDRFRENETRIHELNYLFWECTLRCNLSCLHCGSDCQSASGIVDMPFEDLLSAVEPLNRIYKPESITVVFTGGEPLLRADLPECGSKLRENGFRWGIVTNGYLYNESVHGRLLAAGMGALTLSIDGLEESHNWLRNNKKSYEKAVDALKLITTAPRLNYDIVTCVNARNIGELPVLKRILNDHGVKAWRLFTIAPIGRARYNQELKLNPGQVHKLMEFIVNSRGQAGMDVKFSCEAWTGKYEKQVRDSFFFCRAGINIASVLADGSISACPNINRHFIQGNIYRDSLPEIWEKKFEVMRNRNRAENGDCSGCSEFSHCRGGAMHLRDENMRLISPCLFQIMNDKKPDTSGD